MKKLFNFLLMLSFVMITTAAQATPTLYVGSSQLHYEAYENVFRWDAGENAYVELDYRDPEVVPTLQDGDVFVGIIRVQDILNANGNWFINDSDQISGIFAQKIQTDGISDGTDGRITIDLEAIGVDATFKTLIGDTFTTGLSGTEVMRLYAQDGAGTTPSYPQGTLAEDVVEATDGIDWMTLGLVESTDYMFSEITPQGTFLDQFAGDAFMGLTVESFWANNVVFNDVIDPEVGNAVDLYGNAELDGHDDFVRLYDGDPSTSPLLYPETPWVFNINDPGWVNTTSTIPEPGTFILFGVGLLSISAFGRRKRK